MSKENSPLVGILMGSDSDWPTMKAAGEALKEFGIVSEAKVISAHRDPHGLEEYVSGAIGRGLKVIICGAGGAAHLAGVTAGLFTLEGLGKLDRGSERFAPRMAAEARNGERGRWSRAVARARGLAVPSET